METTMSSVHPIIRDSTGDDACRPESDRRVQGPAIITVKTPEEC